MYNKSICLWVGRDKRDVLMELSIAGYGSVSEAREGLVEHLKNEGVDGDEAGSVVSIELKEDAVFVVTDRCGFWIFDTYIQRAIKAGGSRVSCS